MMKGAQARVLPRMDGVFDEKGAERHNAKGRGRFQSLWDGSASGAADRQQPAERSDRFEETYRRIGLRLSYMAADFADRIDIASLGAESYSRLRLLQAEPNGGVTD